jgi:hypothetical protein
MAIVSKFIEVASGISITTALLLAVLTAMVWIALNKDVRFVDMVDSFV